MMLTLCKASTPDAVIVPIREKKKKKHPKAEIRIKKSRNRRKSTIVDKSPWNTNLMQRIICFSGLTLERALLSF